MERPASGLQLLLPEAVALAGGMPGVVPRAVGLYRKDHSPGLVGVGAGEIYPIAGHAVLGRHRDSALLQAMQHIQLESVERDVAQRRSQLRPAGFGEFQVLAQQFHSSRGRPTWVHIAVRKRRHHVHARPGASDGDIEAPLAALLIERPEPVGQRAVGGLVVADAEYDDVALVALHALDALHEKALIRAVAEEFLQRRIRQFPQADAPPLLDVVGVPDSESDDAERLAGMLARVLYGHIHHFIHLVRVGDGMPLRQTAEGNEVMQQRNVLGGVRKRG